MAITQMPRTFTANHIVSTDEANGLGAPNRCDGRLTLTSGTAVTTADVTAAGTIYFTPYKGNEVALFDGTHWISYEFTERSLALTLTAASVYDVFLYNSAGTLTLETLIWTNATTRATALVLQDGIYCKTGALTRRYLGTIYASGTNTTEDSITKRYVWNHYNQMPRRMLAQETTASWTYASSALRGSNNSTVCRLNMVIGLSEAEVVALAHANVNFTTTAHAQIAIGLDSTSAASVATTDLILCVGSAGGYGSGSSRYSGYPGIGFHYLQQLEANDGSGNTGTWLGSATGRNSNIQGTVFA